MKIAVVTEHCCIRVLKQCEVLSRMGYEIYLVSNKPVSNRMFRLCLYYDGIKQFRDAITLLKDHVSLFHVHNEPSWMVTVIRDMFEHVPIVFDVHDSSYWRIQPDMLTYINWAEEDVAYDCASAYVFPSESCYRFFEKRDEFGYKPAIVLPSACSEVNARYRPMHYRIGLVSQGGHNITQEHVNGGEKEYPVDGWRDYRELYRQLVGGGIRVYMYSSSVTGRQDDPFDSEYIKTGVIMGSFSYGELLDRVSTHTWNLVGNIPDHPVWKYALPNKLFDAIAAGTPSVVFNCKEAAELVEESGIGIAVDSVDEFIRRWDEHRKCRTNLMLHRKNYFMENYIDRLTKLYKQLA